MIPSKQSQSDTANQQQQRTNRSGTSNNRRKNARSANKKRQKAAAVAATTKNLNNDNEYKQEKNATLPKNKIEAEEEAEAEEEESLIESSLQSTNEEQDEEEEFSDPIVIDEALIYSTTAFIQKEKESSSSLKQRNKDKTNPMNSKSLSPISTISTNATNCSLAPQFSSKQGSIVPLKPKANVAPVKQVMSSTNTANTESNPPSQVNNSKSIENSPSSYNIYSYSEHSSGLPRFQQQQRQEIDTFATQKFHRKKTATQTKTPSMQLDSSTRENDVGSLASKQKLSKNTHFELPIQSHQHESFNSDGYSSESNNLSESPSSMLSNNNNHSSLLPISTESQCSLKRPEIKPTVSTSNILLDKLVSVFDNVSFSSEQLELILKKLTAKQFSNRQDWQHLPSTKAKNDKTIERIFEEMYHSQAKILAIELQIEKSRVLELTKTNVEMTNTIKHFQQPNENMAPYQQTIVSYQMQLRGLTDENARLLHQLHVYSMMPNSINELKQQQNILDEQLRQISNRNSSLEKEISDGERARKHAAEIYKKADAQKQERIEQMIDDLNKYKKIDKDLGTIRQKHKELKNNLNSKLDEVSNERDKLEKYGDQLNRKIQQYEPLKIEYEQLIQNEAETSNLDKLQQELNELKAKNDLLRQRHIMFFNKLLLVSLLIYYYCTIAQSEIIQLTSHNISQYLQDHVTFVKFYANWCPHSKKLESTWTRFAETKTNTDLHVAEIDCSQDALICSDHDIFGYPTLKLFVRGSGARYEGPRQIESLEAFYREKLAEDVNFEDNVATKKPIIELTTENFAQMTAKDFAFIVFFAPWCSHCKMFKPVFQELAKQMINIDGLMFATVDCTTHQNLCERQRIKGYPTLIWFEDGVEKDRYVEARELNRIQNYIELKLKEAKHIVTEAPPTVQYEEEQTNEELSEADNILNIKTFTQGVSFEGYAFVNFGAPWCSHCQKLAPIWNQLAHKFSHHDEIRISRVDCTASESLCRDYGIRAFPTLILFRYGESKVEYNGSRDFDSLYNFLVGQIEFFGDEYLLKQDYRIKNE
ncbi:unnamed protein product [Rotaria magnacalcarata]|uniref:Thioredoxin domain-containing protein n=2 Tax=Rotaria magnacalcarata TaxID=392030 RepID=A0A8S2IFX7_9BILA|nr:unnamed protein product [Rotaria magnacalcarata]CAF3788356.1 unnamed protein product [Rotaria magnacalcarata]CAF3802045.1 unnamed protein product [Rotaria magnacalcarata]